MMHWEIPVLGWTVNPVVVALFFGIIIAYRIFTRKKYHLPPGPFALPIIGNLIQMYFMKEKLFRTLVEWTKQYGPIISLRIGTQQCVVLNNIELTLEATVKKQTEFAGRPYFPSGDYLTMGGKDIVFADYGPTWKLHRKIAFLAMKNYAMGANLEKKVHTAFEKISENLLSVEGPVRLKEYISLMIFNFICGFCWGQSYELDDEEFRDMVTFSDRLNVVFANGLPEDIIPFLRHFPSSKRTEIYVWIDKFFTIIRKKYDHHRDTFNPDNIRNFIDDLLMARLEAVKEEKSEMLEQLTDTHLYQTIGDIFGAGTDTSRFTLIWAIYYMVKYPDIQEKVHEEISHAVGHDRLPGLGDREKLAYTEATLHEVMRIDTTVPMGLPHSAMVDSTIGGYDIPKDTTVFFNVWALHMDPKYWPDPEKFDPNRFLDADGTRAPKPTSFFPFSAGRRICLGEAVAKPQLLLLFACLMHRFRYSLPPGTELPTETPPGALVNLPNNDFTVVVSPRY